MKRLTHSIAESMRRFHQDEQGDAIQMILVVAAAAIILFGVLKMTKDTVIKETKDSVSDLIGASVTN